MPSTKPNEPKAIKVPKPQRPKPSSQKRPPEAQTSSQDAQDLTDQLAALTLTVQQQSEQITDLYTLLAHRRKPATNGKVQIQDTVTGTTYPSKNNCYQSLLKAGELNDLVDKGVFGNDPAKNNFGWFALNRSYPDRFEEVRDDGNAQPS
jgi:hypothetical protein